MKWTAAVSLAIAPVVLAKSVHNVYPAGLPRRSPPSPGHDDHHGNSNSNDFGGLVDDVAVVQEEIIILWVCPGNNQATQTLNAASTVTVTAGASGITQGSNTIPPGSTGTVPPGSGATHSVTVGGSAGLVYSPDTIAANVGDSVIFTFLSANHTVTQSSFATPCEKLDGGMDSGFQPNPNNTVNPPPQVAMQVMSSGPLWFYCRQKGHCGKGMTFSINPTAAKTQADFQAAAIAQNGTGTDSAITGGSSSAAAPPPPPAASGAADSNTSFTATLGGSATATAAADASASTGVVNGVGSLNADGSCACTVLCAVGVFPAAAQGIGGFGGVGGALPMTTSVA